MNGNASVDEALAQRVRAVVTELNYSASPLARSLVLGRTNTVAVVIPDLGNPSFQGVLRGLSHAAARNGYHILIADTAEAVAEEPVLARQTRRRCDGLVLVAPRMAESDLAELLSDLQPVVLVSREPVEPSPTPVVTADYGGALIELLDLLYADGHRSVLFLAGAPQSASNSRRLTALASFSTRHPDLALHVQPCGVNFADGYDAADAVLAAGVTAALAFNDLVAMGLTSALTERGIAIPGRISVVGFDDIPFARYVTPPLTTAAVPVAELGEQAWLRMWDLLEGREPAPTLTLNPQVQWRGSAGPAPRRATETAIAL